MPSWLPSFDYPPPKQGVWLPVTSTLNWCEEDYYATKYSAEIVNTLTNLLFIILAARGIRNCVQNGHDTIFLVTFCGYLLVGSGSFAFHSTLKYPMQLVDELSMIYTTCLMCWASFGHGRRALYQILLGIFLVALALFITLYYHYLQDPTFHQNAYAILTAIVLTRSLWVMEARLRPSLARRVQAQKELLEKYKNGGLQFDGAALSTSTEEQERRDGRDRHILRTMWLMVSYGLSVFLGGFALWSLDNEYCGTLRKWRHELGLPWGVLLEGHGWWHLMTGTGAYFYITWGIWLRHCLNGRQDEYELVWPRMLTSLPFIVKKRSTGKTNGSVQNGGAKKNI